MKLFGVKIGRRIGVFLFLLFGSAFLSAAVADEAFMSAGAGGIGIGLEGYEYPYKVEFLPLTIEGQDLRMAYMDVPPDKEPNGKTVVLLHGKNFFGSYWRNTIHFLTRNGFRVIVPDQIGFGKSSKPNMRST